MGQALVRLRDFEEKTYRSLQGIFQGVYWPALCGKRVTPSFIRHYLPQQIRWAFINTEDPDIEPTKYAHEDGYSERSRVAQLLTNQGVEIECCDKKILVDFRPAF